MIYVAIIIFGIGFILYKQHRDKRLILYIENHKLYTFAEQQIKKVDSLSVNNIKSPYPKHELEKRIWCGRKFGTLNIQMIILEDFKKRIDHIVDLYKNKKHKEIENLMTSQNWGYFLMNAHVRWMNKCSDEYVNMKMVHRFMEYHEKNNVFFNESMHEILVLNEMKKNTLEQLYDIQNLMLSTLSFSSSMMEEIINMNGDVSESFEDWLIPDEY